MAATGALARDEPARRWPLGWGGQGTWRPLLAGLAILLLVQLPGLLTACCGAAGTSGFGTATAGADFAQYESAMRQGATTPGWLIYDQFTAEPHQPAFMLPLYVGLGKLAALTGWPALTLERGLEVLARALLILAVWRFAQAFALSRAATWWGFGLTLLGAGVMGVGALTEGSRAWTPETSMLAALLAAPHLPLALATQLELARGGLRPRRGPPTPGWLASMAGLGLAVALLYPFPAPALFGALLVTGLVFWRSGQDRSATNLLGAGVAILAALPVLWPTISTFSFDPFWLATYGSQDRVATPMPHELLLDYGMILALAVGGTLAWRTRVAPFGLLVWLLLGLIAIYLPVPYQRRLGLGLQPALAVIAANTLVLLASTVRMRWAGALQGVVGALAVGASVLVFALLLGAALGRGPLTLARATPDLDAAAAWLDSHAASDEVILGTWSAMNYLAPRTPARTYGGHELATLHPSQKAFAAATVFAHPSSLAVARTLGADWLVIGPGPTAAELPAADPAFQAGDVRVYRVSPPR